MKKILLIICVVYISFICGFAASYLIRPTAVPVISVNPQNTVKIPTKPLELEDADIVLVTTDMPRKVFHINHLLNRREDYYQAQLVYSFKGTDLQTAMIPVENILVTPLINSENNKAYKIEGNFTVGKNKISFVVPFIELNMVVRAQSEVGKFAGTTKDSSIIIDDKSYDSTAAVTLGYFNKFEPIDTLDYKVHTYWMMYFDGQNNFYHLDKSVMEKSTEIYYPHTFMAEMMPSENIVKYFSNINIVQNGSNQYVINYSNLNTNNISLDVVSKINIYSKAQESLVTSNDGGIGVLIELDATK